MAESLAVTVSAIGLVEVAEGQFNLDVTPVGRPDRARFTFSLLRPTGLTTPIEVLALLPPTRRVRLLDEEERLKLGTGMVTAMVVELVRVPEVPITLTEYFPGTAVLPGVSVRALFHGLLGELKVAATPLGTPEAAKITLPLNPF
jgi:hypothetical protein